MGCLLHASITVHLWWKDWQWIWSGMLVDVFAHSDLSARCTKMEVEVFFWGWTTYVLYNSAYSCMFNLNFCCLLCRKIAAKFNVSQLRYRAFLFLIRWVTSLFGLVFRWDQNTDQQKVKSIFSFGLSDRWVIHWDQSLDSVIAETKVNPNFLHYGLLVLHGRDTLIL